MKKPYFIAVEGPIGIGKSTLAELISKKYDFYLLKEIVEENPFLSKFYDNLDSWAFQTEMFFLCNRYKQINDIHKEYLTKGQSVVADYHIFKNHIFSKMTLDEEHYQKYSAIFDILIDDTIQPNIIIYINASLDTIMKRIKKRGRDIEKNIQPNYIQRLSNDYDLFIKEFKKKNPDIPVLEFNGDDIDFVNHKQDLDYIFNELDKVLQK